MFKSKTYLYILLFVPILVHIYSWVGVFDIEVVFYYFISLILCFFSFKLLIKKKYYLRTPLFFVLFIIISYFHRIILVDKYIDEWTLTGGYQRIGNFIFQNSSIIEYFQIIISGLLGVLLANYFIIRLKLPRSNWGVLSNVRLKRYYKVYIFSYLIIIIIASFFKIGVSGYSPIALPFKLAGLILFLKNFIIPMFGWYLFYFICESNKQKKIVYFLLLQILIGVIGTYLTLSKAMLIYAILPYVIYLIFSKKYLLFKRKQIRVFTILISFLVMATFYGALYMRFVDSGITNNISVYAFFDSYFRNSDENVFMLLFETLIYDISTRITGGSELMAVMFTNIENPWNSILMILNGNAGDVNSGMPELIERIFDITLIFDGEVFSGKSIGFWGILFLMKSKLFIFFGTFVYVSIIAFIEKLYYRNINPSISILLSFWLCYNVWESGFDLFVFLIPISIFLFFYHKFFLKSKYVLQ